MDSPAELDWAGFTVELEIEHDLLDLSSSKVNNIYYLLCDDLYFLAGLKKLVIGLVLTIGLLEAMLSIT